MLEEIKAWQDGLGAIVGFIGLIVVTQVTLWDIPFSRSTKS